jgi:glycosyltransferase involved in cell wall biosynthesis
LVVHKKNALEIGGVKTIASPLLTDEQIPDADYIIIHADCDNHEAIAKLSSSKGKRILFFQGWGDRKNARKIKKGFRFAGQLNYNVFCCSEYLKQEILKKGLQAEIIHHGLDFDIFYPNSSPHKNLNITMLSHNGRGKRLQDGLKALNFVQKKIPHARFVFFGDHPPMFKGNFIYRADRNEVADILRKSTIFVCSRLREGFGLPGLEAMACGAVLATTDTGGCREYAIHGKTALISPPKKPQLLANNILALATDQSLQKKLRSQGLMHIQNNFKTWDGAARSLLDRLSALH